MHRLEARRLVHAAADQQQDQRRQHAGEQHVAPAIRPHPGEQLAPDQAAKPAAGHHDAQHLGALRLREGLGDQRDAHHQLRAGADTGEEAADAEHDRPLRETLQRGEDRHHHHAERQGANAADIVADNAEEEAADRPAEQPDHAEDATDPTNLGDRGIAAQ